MKKFRKILSFVLVIALAAGMLAGCESEEEKLEKLMGTWTMVTQATEEETMVRLENIELYEEEIALVDMTSLYYVEQVKFTDSTYRFGFAVEETKEYTREFYRDVFDALYDGRTTLNEAYGMEFDQMTKEEFQQFYAELYSMENYDAMIDHFADIAYVYDEAFETGTFSIKGNKLQCITTGETQVEDLGYEIDGNTLTLTYVNAVEVYTRY